MNNEVVAIVKISSTTDPNLREFKSLHKQSETKGILDDDRPAPRDRDDATLAPGLDGVEGMNDAATSKEIKHGESTRVIKMEYDEYDASEPEE